MERLADFLQRLLGKFIQQKEPPKYLSGKKGVDT
jgi:hypothetical protein|tara:strand:- start:645 stop:746 length:102 start_codon:yes stop_codon:yes gene_type:complete